jgi:hypothetical protein
MFMAFILKLVRKVVPTSSTEWYNRGYVDRMVGRFPQSDNPHYRRGWDEAHRKIVEEDDDDE